jgi:serine protease
MSFKMKVVSISLILVLAFFAGCMVAPEVENTSVEFKVGQPYVEISSNDYDSLIIKLRDGSRAVAGDLEKFGKVETRKMNDQMEVSVVRMDRETVDAKEAMAYYRSLPEVEYVEPNYNMYAFTTPNDTYYQYQWHMSQLNMPDAWDITMGSSSVKVAVIDTGVAYDLSDLSGTAFDLVNDKDFVNNDMDAYDDNAHGTHCAGTIAQTTNNASGTVGMAPNITILPLKVLANSGSGATDGIAAAIIWAADHGTDVISMSLGGGGFSQTMYDALEYAYNAGVVIFAAAGNDGTGTVSYPAAYNEWVIAVGSTRYDKQKAPYSQYGSALDIMAPGGDTSVDQNGDGYADGVLQQTITGYNSTTKTTDYTPGYFFFQGTSMACPHAAGLGALLKSHKLDATPAQIRAAMENTAEDLGAAGWDSTFGWGLMDPVAALNYIVGAPNPDPDPEPDPDPTGSVHQTQTVNDSLSYTYNREDNFTIAVAEGTVNLSLNFSTANLCDMDLFLYNPSGTKVASSEGSTSTETIAYNTNGVTGTYTVKVYMYNIKRTVRKSYVNYTLDADWYAPAQ